MQTIFSYDTNVPGTGNSSTSPDTDNPDVDSTDGGNTGTGDSGTPITPDTSGTGNSGEPGIPTSGDGGIVDPSTNPNETGTSTPDTTTTGGNVGSEGYGNPYLENRPIITNEQLGNKMRRHGIPDYGFAAGKEGAQAYRDYVNNALNNTTEIRAGSWKNSCNNAQFWISGNDVSIINADTNEWITTFPLSKPGTMEYIKSLPIIWGG